MPGFSFALASFDACMLLLHFWLKQSAVLLGKGFHEIAKWSERQGELPGPLSLCTGYTSCMLYENMDDRSWRADVLSLTLWGVLGATRSGSYILLFLQSEERRPLMNVHRETLRVFQEISEEVSFSTEGPATSFRGAMMLKTDPAAASSTRLARKDLHAWLPVRISVSAMPGFSFALQTKLQQLLLNRLWQKLP